MASPVITEIGRGSSKTSSLFIDASPASGVSFEVGDLIVACVAMDPTTAIVTPALSGRTTTAQSGPWTVLGDYSQGSGTSGVRSFVAYAVITQAGIVARVTSNFSSAVVAKATVAYKVSGTDGSSPIWNSGTSSGGTGVFLAANLSPYGNPQEGYQYTAFVFDSVEAASGGATTSNPISSWAGGGTASDFTYVSSDSSTFGTSGQGASSNISFASGWSSDTWHSGYATGIQTPAIISSGTNRARVAVIFIAPWTVQTCSPTQIGGVVSSKTYFENVADGTAPSSANTGASLTVYSTPTIVTDGVLGKAINLSDNNLDLVFMAFGDTTQLSGTFQCDFNIVSSSNNGTIIAIHSGSGTSFVSLKIGGINTFYLFDATRQVGTNSPTFSINTKYTCTLWADLMTRKVGVVVRDSSGAIFWETSGTSTYDQLAADATAKIIDAAINSGGNNTRFKNLATSVGISRGISDAGLPAIDISLPSTRPTTIASTEAFGTPVLAAKITSSPAGIALTSRSLDTLVSNATGAAGIVVSSSTGHIYVCDQDNNLVREYDETGAVVTSWTTTGSPYGIVFDSSGNIYVTDQSSFLVRKFDSSGNLITSWSTVGTPIGIAIDNSNNIYVAEVDNNLIRKFSSTGVAGITMATSNPHGVDIDSSGNVYVAEYSNNRVKKMSSTGTQLATYSMAGAPFDLKINKATGEFYVTDITSHVVRRFSSSGTELESWPIPGGNLAMGLAIDSFENLYVTNYTSKTILKYSPVFGKLTVAWVVPTSLTGIATAQAMGNPTLAVFVTSTPTGLPSVEVFGTTVLGGQVTTTLTGIASAQAFGNPSIAVIQLGQNVTLVAIASAEVFGNPVLTTRITSVLTGVASLEATGNPSLATFVTAQPTQIASAEILGTPSLTAKVTSSFFGIATAEAFGAPTLVWPTTTFPTNIASAELLGNPILGGMVALSPIMIASAEALGVPNLGASLASIPNAIASAEALGNPTLAAKVTAGLTGIASLNAFGALALSTIIGTNPTQIASTELFGNPALSSFVTVNWLGIGTAEAYGTPSIAARITSALTGIASAGALGTPSLLAKIASLPTGIASAEIFNDLVIDAALRIFPVPIDTLEAVSILTLDTFIELIPDAIDTAEVFGDLFMGQIVTSHVTAGIPTAVEFGVPTINPVIDMLPVGIITTEIIPAPVLVAYVGVSPEAIDTAEVVNDPILDLHTTVLLSGIASVGGMGAITVTPFIVSTPTGVISLEAFGLLDAELLARVEFAGWGLPVG